MLWQRRLARSKLPLRQDKGAIARPHAAAQDAENIREDRDEIA
jgi:hypothetical protein